MEKAACFYWEAGGRSFCFLCLDKPPEIMEEVGLQVKNIRY